MIKKLLILAAIAGGIYALVNKRKQAAEAEARLWDEATGRADAAAEGASETSSETSSGTAAEKSAEASAEADKDAVGEQ